MIARRIIASEIISRDAFRVRPGDFRWRTQYGRGISQVRRRGNAVTQLDQVTQQNAALVEEGAAAAESLKHRAARLSELMGAFTIEA